jgi:hypothetical protein
MIEKHILQDDINISPRTVGSKYLAQMARYSKSEKKNKPSLGYCHSWNVAGMLDTTQLYCIQHNCTTQLYLNVPGMIDTTQLVYIIVKEMSISKNQFLPVNS